MPITALPTPPSRQDPTNFNDRADAFLGALPQFQTEANALQTNVNTSEVNTVNAAAAVLSATNIVKWVSGTTYANGAVVWSPINGLAYRRITVAGSGTTDPSLDTTNYKQVNGTGDVSTSGNQTIAGTKTFSSTISGSISGNSETVTNGVYTVGDQTIAGNKTFSSPIIFPDSTIQTTGVTTVRAVLFTASGSYTKPANVRALFIQAVGATGGRAYNTQGYGQGGAGGAGYSEKYIASPASSYAVTIGAAGNTGGTSGGTTSVSTISITGAAGTTNGQTAGGAGGVATGGDFNANGGTGGAGWGGTYGAGGGGGAAGGRSGAGFNGGTISAVAYGAGGGGGGTASAGGTGGNTNSPGAGGNAATVYSASIIQPILAFDPPSLQYGFQPGTAGAFGFNEYNGAGAGTGGNGANNSAPVYGSVGTPSRLYSAGGYGGRGYNGVGGAAAAGVSGSVLIWEFI